jgi:phosphohistidine phosphatase
MRVYLFRHGPAENRDPLRWPNDEDRPLSADGVKATREAAKGFARLATDVKLVVTSPAKRAYRTAELVHEGLGMSRKLVEWSELAPDAGTQGVLARVARPSMAREVPVLVGHEPTLSELIGLALTGESVSVAHVSKAGAAAIDFEAKVAPGAGELGWLVTRGQLVDFGR